jgi:hypothetical protein
MDEKGKGRVVKTETLAMRAERGRLNTLALFLFKIWPHNYEAENPKGIFRFDLP